MRHSSAPVSLIVASALLRLLEEEIPELDRFVTPLDEEGVLHRFPDGSLFIHGRQACERFYEVYQAYRSAGSLVSGLGYRALGSFAEAQYLLDFPKSYSEALDPRGFYGGNPNSEPPY